jgi:hypothetical protein
LIAQERELIANGYRLLRCGISEQDLATIIAHLFCFEKGFTIQGRDEVPPKVCVEGIFNITLDERTMPSIRQWTHWKKNWVCFHSTKNCARNGGLEVDHAIVG